MRRFVALLGVVLLVMGIRLYNNGLLNCGYAGAFSYGTYDTVAYDVAPLLIDGPHRIDVQGGVDTAYGIIANLDGKLLWTEEVGDMTVMYAYSPRLNKPLSVLGHQVNLMIAVTETGVAAGTPLLYGSY